MSLWKHNLLETAILTEYHLPSRSQDLQVMAGNSLQCQWKVQDSGLS